MAFNKSITVGRNGVFKTRYMYKQKSPYLAPLPYHCYGSVSNSAPNSTGEFATNSLSLIQGYAADGSNTAKQAAAKAYDKIVGNLKGEASAMLAVNVGERREAFAMIANRGGQLYSALRNFRKFDIPAALGDLGFKLKFQKTERLWVRVGKGRTHSISNDKVVRDTYLLRRKAKKVGSLWLEYWFGWSPLISDIKGAIDVLQDLNLQLSTTFTGSGNAVYEDVKNDPWFYRGQWWVYQRRLGATFGCKYRCKMKIHSPNAFNANRLGLTNPATVAWELIPFSFLVDWFLPVGKFLDQYTDLVGLTVYDVQCSERRISRHTLVETSPWGSDNIVDSAFMFRRSILGSLPVPGLLDRSGNGITSITRAATAISLLTGFLKSSKWS